MTKGPYYVPGDKVRPNITEGKPGVPLLLWLTVLDVSTCKAIDSAAVDIWHREAGGFYSKEAALGTENRTFLRGIQRTTRERSRGSGRSIQAGTAAARCTST